MLNFGGAIGIQAMKNEGEKPELPLNQICLRAQNKYINDFDEAASLKESILKDGLIEPITVCDIEEFLKNDDIYRLPTEDYEYYKKQLERGFKYFIITGHRRFRAYCSLAVGHEVHFDTDVDSFYEEFEEIYKRDAEAIESGHFENRNKFCSIKCFVVKDTVKQEASRYNNSNLDQRKIQDFEIVDNIIDEMKAEGVYDKEIQQNHCDKVDSMTERTIINTFKRLELPQNYKTLSEAKEVLKNIDPNLLPGYNDALNKSIMNYIKDKKSKKVSVSAVNLSRKIIETFEKRYIKLIYDGVLTFKNAIDLLTYYDKIDKDDTYNKIVSGEYNFKEEKKKHSPNIQKNKLTMVDVGNYARKLKDGAISIEEFCKILEQNNIL